MSSFTKNIWNLWISIFHLCSTVFIQLRHVINGLEGVSLPDEVGEDVSQEEGAGPAPVHHRHRHVGVGVAHRAVQRAVHQEQSDLRTQVILNRGAK